MNTNIEVKQDAISQLPWILDERFPFLIYCDDIAGSAVCKCDLSETHFITKEQRTANCKAIVTAVNNTYGKSINPEGVEELKKALQELLECDYTSGTHLYCAQIRAKAAIKAATL